MAIIQTGQTFKRLQQYLSNNQTSFTNLLLEIVIRSETALNFKFSRRAEDLFTGTKLLEDEDIENRVTGIYDLEKFAQKYPEYHGEIIGILTHFVQNNAANICSDEFNPNLSTTISPDIQVALTVIGRRDTNQDDKDEQLDLSYTDMRGANLNQAHLESSNLYRVNLCEANLSGANLSGAILSAANLSGANLSGANLSGAILSAANLSGANLSGANLQRANLYLANLQAANLEHTIFTGANLREAKFP